jgi:hypothetical protein
MRKDNSASSILALRIVAHSRCGSILVDYFVPGVIVPKSPPSRLKPYWTISLVAKELSRSLGATDTTSTISIIETPCWKEIGR